MTTVVFLTAVALSVSLRLWLAMRQSRYVLAHRSNVPAAFTADIALDQHQKAADYTLTKIRFSRASLAVEVVFLLILTLGGLLQRLADFWLTAFDGAGYAYGLALFASVGLLGLLIDLPLRAYQTFVIEAKFGFNKMTPKLFAADIVKQLLLSVVIGAPLLLAVLWLMAVMGANWWLYVWLLWLGFNLLALLLYPTLIAPLFNKFTPLPEGPLKERISSLLARCGFAASGLFVMDGSKRSARGNAYFSGFGKAKRIVFFDTLIDKLTAAEIEAVLAHELGHFSRHHLWKSLTLIAAFSFGLLWLLGRLIEAPGFFLALGVSTPGTAMALILFAQVLPIFLFPLTPLATAFSRRNEYDADAYAAAHAGADDLVSALVKLYRENAATLTPDPLHSLFYDSHPPASLRIAHLKDGTT